MQTPTQATYKFTFAACTAADKLSPNTVSEQEHKRGMANAEPITIMMDCLIKYAATYRSSMEQPLSEDYIFGPIWLDAATNIRRLLNGDGVNAMSNRGGDSKCNGAVEEMFWRAVEVAGFSQEDVK